jgi:hypothetical protein
MFKPALRESLLLHTFYSEEEFTSAKTLSYHKYMKVIMMAVSSYNYFAVLL